MARNAAKKLYDVSYMIYRRQRQEEEGEEGSVTGKYGGRDQKGESGSLVSAKKQHLNAAGNISANSYAKLSTSS